MQYCGIDLSKACSDGYVLAVYRTGVEFGKWNGDGFPWADKHEENNLLELHIFNKEKEFRAIRSVRRKDNGDFIVSEITDYYKKYENENVKTKSLENKMLMFGEEFVGSGDGYYIARESGREKKIYLNMSKEDFKKGIYLKVIDYYDFDENMLMYLSRYRLAEVCVGEEC